MGIEVDIQWELAEPHDSDPRWQLSRVLYAVLHPTRPIVAYLGKAWSTTVRERWDAPDKLADGAFWPEFERIFRCKTHRNLVGHVHTNRRLTFELLCDIESLLIFAIGPLGNIQNTSSRGIERPGLRVTNHGAWPKRGHRMVWETPDAVHWSR